MKKIAVKIDGKTYLLTEKQALQITAIGVGCVLGLFLGLLLTEQDA